MKQRLRSSHATPGTRIILPFFFHFTSVLSVVTNTYAGLVLPWINLFGFYRGDGDRREWVT